MKITELQQLADDVKDPLAENDLVYYVELKEVLDKIIEELAGRGVKVVPSVSTLSTLSGDDFKQILVQDTGWFVFIGEGFPDNVTSFAADEGGVWYLVWPISTTPPAEDYEVTVTLSGGELNNGQTFYQNSLFVGKSVRAYKNGVLMNSTQKAFTSVTGRFDFVTPVATGEVYSFTIH